MNAEPITADAPALPMTPEVLSALAQLHDLQLAAANGLVTWPWVLVAAGLVLAALLARAWWRQPKQRFLRRLRRVERTYRAARGRSPDDAGSRSQLAAAIASLLREAAINSRKVSRMPAGLAGDAWLSWLDRQAPAADRGGFVGGVGQDLLRWPYLRTDACARPDDQDPVRADALLRLTARWLRANA